MKRRILYFILCAAIFGLSCKNVRTESIAERLTTEDSTLQANESLNIAQPSDTVPDKSESVVDSASVGDKPSQIYEDSDKANLSETSDTANKPETSDASNGRQSEPHPGFVYVKDYVPDVIEDIRYSTDNNFMGAVVNGYKSNAAIITKKAAEKLKEAADEFRAEGYVIKIYDAYRPQKAVDHFVRWAKTADQKNKAAYYPDIAKKNLFPRYIATKSGHSKGSTLDLTICDAQTKKELDMGSHFDYFGSKSHTMWNGATKEQRNNRLLLKRVMEKHGFINYANEWWHYTLKNEPYPHKYFDFDVKIDP